MPIYEYECNDCGHRLERLQKVTDAPLARCPACATASLRKLVSAAAFRLKGSGWYETDFKGEESRRNLAKGDDKPKRADRDEGKPADAAGDGQKDKRKSVGDSAASTAKKPAAGDSAGSAA